MGTFINFLCIVSLTSLLFQEGITTRSSTSSDFPVVNLPHGAVKGKKVTRPNLPTYWAFLGIPFARPPIEKLRFKPPVEPEPWTGIRDALEEGNMCRQLAFTEDSFVGDEDCLFINVYTPSLPDARTRSLKPVMLWMYGGSFNSGSGDRIYQGPDYLLDKGVVYVSFNYRLGIIGFLSTEDEEVPGNAAMKDQVMVLRWVQKNIAKFGGDPNSVTIFGESSGAGAVGYHMLSPMSKGLFHRAITESGSVANRWALAYKPKEYAFLVGKSLGFTGSTSRQLAEFLRNVPADRLLNASLTTYPERDRYRFGKIIYLPSIEVPVKGEEIFIPDNPLRLLADGKFYQVPLITGVNSAEGLVTLESLGIRSNFSKIPEINEDFDKFFKQELRICKEDPCGDEILAKVRSFYFGDKPFTVDTIYNFIDMWSDMTFTEGVMYTVKKIIEHSREPVFLYQFSYEGDLAYLKRLFGAQDYKGVCHGDELGYIFNITGISSTNKRDLDVRDAMVTMWTNFAKTGNPTPSSQTKITKWHPYTKSSRNYYDIGDKFLNKKDLHKERVDLWHRVYSQYAN